MNNEIDQRIREVLMLHRRNFSPATLKFPIIIIDIGGTTKYVSNAEITYVTLKTADAEFIIDRDNEEQTILQTLEILSRYKNGTIIGFNCFCYDLPVLERRAKFHKLPPIDIGNWLDLRSLLSDGNPYAKGKLSEFAGYLGFKEKCYGWCKKHHKFLRNNPDIPELREFLLYDVRATYLILEYLMSSCNETINLPKMHQSTLCEGW
jgi:hypothetical protein